MCILVSPGFGCRAISSTLIVLALAGCAVPAVAQRPESHQLSQSSAGEAPPSPDRVQQASGSAHNLDTFVANGLVHSQAWYEIPETSRADGQDSAFAWARAYSSPCGGCFEVVLRGARLAAMRGHRFVVLRQVPRAGENLEMFPGRHHDSDSEEGAGASDASDPAPVDTDVTGDGVPEAIVAEWSGGAHCCTTLHIVQFTPQPHVQRIELRDSATGVFVQADRDAALEMRIDDWTFASWDTSFARSPAPDMIWKFDGRDWKPCAALMRKPPRTAAELDEMASRWKGWDLERNSSAGSDAEVPWSAMLDLVYSGNAAQAWQVLDRGWPGSPARKAEFRERLLRQLRMTPASAALVEVNGTALDG